MTAMDLPTRLLDLLDTWLAVLTFLAVVAVAMTIVCWRMGLIDTPRFTRSLRLPRRYRVRHAPYRRMRWVW